MTTARTATRAALYCRISEDQLGEAEGVDDQRRDGLELCKAKGWTATVFTDNDQTASKKGRGKRRDDFEDMIAAVKRGEFDVIVCRDWARLTRDHLAGAILIDMGDTLRSFIVWYFGLDGEQSWKLGIDWATGFGVSDAEDENARGARYAREIGEKVRRRKLSHARAGRPSGGTRPFGYTGTGTTQTVDPYQKALVIEAVDAILDGGATPYSIAVKWTADGVATKHNKRWAPGTICKVLTTPAIAGFVPYHGGVLLDDNGQPVKGNWPAIIPVDRWEAVCARLATKSTDTVRPLARSYLLRGIAQCDNCGQWMIGTGGGKEATSLYVCKGNRKIGGGNGCGRSISAAKTEHYVTWLACEVLDADGLSDVVHAEHEADTAEARNAYERIRTIDALLAGWADDRNAERVPVPEYHAATGKLRTERAELSARAATLRGTSVLDTYAGRGTEFATFARDTQRAVVSALIESVSVRPSDKRGRGAWTPNRLDVHWRYSAVEPLMVNLFTDTPSPFGAYMAARDHFGLAEWDAANLERARDLSHVPIKVLRDATKAMNAETKRLREARKAAKV